MIDFKNLRYNVFTGVWYPKTITAEPHIIAFQEESNSYGFWLFENPQQNSPQDVVIKLSGSPFTEFTEVPFSQSPNSEQYRIDYLVDRQFATGFVNFNAADDGKEVEVDYKGLGTAVLNDYTLLQTTTIPTSVNIGGDLDVVGNFDKSGTEFLTASGTWTPPDNVTEIIILIAAGGGGGCAVSSTIYGSGGGSSCSLQKVTIVEGEDIVYTIGAGGVGSAAGGAGGLNGEDSTFGAITQTGGKGGLTTAAGFGTGNRGFPGTEPNASGKSGNGGGFGGGKGSVTLLLPSVAGAANSGGGGGGGDNAFAAADGGKGFIQIWW